MTEFTPVFPKCISKLVLSVCDTNATQCGLGSYKLLASLSNPVVARCTACGWGSSLTRTVGSNPAGGMNVISSVFVVFRHVEVSESGRSLVQRSLTECGVSESDREASIIRKPWSTRGCCATEKRN
jgi:hypothetical protein